MTTAPPSSGTLDDATPVSPCPSAIRALVGPPPIHPLGDPLARRNRARRQTKPPKDSKVYKHVLAIIALKAQGLRNAEVAETLGLSVHTIKVYLARSHRKGWINLDSFDDPEDQLEHILKSKTVRNINTALDETEDENGKMTSRAFEASMAVAKGTGLFKSHEIVKTDTTTQVGGVLKVQVIQPPNVDSNQMTLRPGAIGGTPAVDAEIVSNQE